MIEKRKARYNSKREPKGQTVRHTILHADGSTAVSVRYYSKMKNLQGKDRRKHYVHVYHGMRLGALCTVTLGDWNTNMYCGIRKMHLTIIPKG